MEAVCSSETLLPLPTYQTPRLPVPQKYIILCACLNLECQVRFAVSLSYCLPVRSCFHLMFPLFPEDGSSMFFRIVVTLPAYLQNDTVSCATRLYRSEYSSQLRILCTIGHYVVLVLPNNKQLKLLLLLLLLLRVKESRRVQSVFFSPDVPAGFILLLILF